MIQPQQVNNLPLYDEMLSLFQQSKRSTACNSYMDEVAHRCFQQKVREA